LTAKVKKRRRKSFRRQRRRRRRRRHRTARRFQALIGSFHHGEEIIFSFDRWDKTFFFLLANQGNSSNC